MKQKVRAEKADEKKVRKKERKNGRKELNYRQQNGRRHREADKFANGESRGRERDGDEGAVRENERRTAQTVSGLGIAAVGRKKAQTQARVTVAVATAAEDVGAAEAV